MVCVPAARDEVVNAAAPPDRVIAPNGVVPSRKLTVPVGVPNEDATLAVNVTALVAKAGFTVLVRPTLAVAWPTIRETVLVAEVYVAPFVGVKVAVSV
jgi:hypothetical protein